MWKRLKIDDQSQTQTLFLQCEISAGEVTLLLVDLLGESWVENQSLEAVVKRSRQLNRRIKYDEELVRTTLVLDDPVQSTWEANVGGEGDAEASERRLKLKYRIGSCPLNFEWHLRRQTRQQFHKSFMLPLIELVQQQGQQIAELRETVRKKDVEILQYQSEGAILRRTTVATSPFIFAQFEEKFAKANTLAKGFQQIAEYFQEQMAQAVKPETEDAKLPTTTKTEIQLEDKRLEVVSPSRKDDKKNSPRNRKRRKADEMKQRQMERQKARKHKLEYENSQSLSQELDDEAQQSTSAAAAMVERKFAVPLLVPKLPEPDAKIDFPPSPELAAPTDTSPPSRDQGLEEIFKQLRKLDEERMADMERRHSLSSVQNSAVL